MAVELQEKTTLTWHVLSSSKNMHSLGKQTKWTASVPNDQQMSSWNKHKNIVNIKTLTFPLIAISKHIQKLVYSPCIWVFIGLNYIAFTWLEISCNICFVTSLILTQETVRQSRMHMTSQRTSRAEWTLSQCDDVVTVSKLLKQNLYS